MRIHISKGAKIFGGAALACALFASGYVTGQNKFGQPKTVLHLAMIKWNPGVSDAQKQQVLDGVKDMAAKIPGIKNVWIKGERLQPRGEFTSAFAIEFKDRDAADTYAESPLHATWEAQYVPLRAASISEQVTNP
jgi:hypothetical protein